MQRKLPVRPDLNQLKRQAKELLHEYRAGGAEAAAAFAAHHPESVTPAMARLADAHLVLARLYEAPSWMRLVQCCQLVAAIWEDDAATLERLVRENPHLLTESALIRDSHWGPPLSYAANLGRDRIIRLLYELGARDLKHALSRAVLQSRVETAAMLYEMLGRPTPPLGSFGGAAYTLSVPGTEFLFRIGARIDQTAPVEAVIGSDSRRPADKRRILALYAEHGYVFPDTAVMAFHRGRFDLLEEHLARDPELLRRTFTGDEIFPPEVGCHHPPYEAMGTPVDGGTLLHLAVYWDELDMATWLLDRGRDRGMDANVRAAVDADGFGGHTPLFNVVVSQAAFKINYRRRAPQPSDTAMAELLLAHGADPEARASIRMRFDSGHSDTRMREFRDVTPLGWGERMARETSADGKHSEPLFVNTAVMRRLADLRQG